MALPLIAVLLALAGEPAPLPDVLARWRGGVLTREQFEARHDVDGRARRGGADALRVAVCKAVFREIYLPRARAQALEREPELQQELEQWRTQNLAVRFQRKHAADAEGPTPAELRSLYERQSPPASVADLDVLFVRCPLRASLRPACAARLAGLSARVEQGEALEAVSAEERGHSGEANGSFSGVRLDQLQSDLSEIAATLPLERLSPVIESPAGLFRLRVRRRQEARRLEFAALESELRRQWKRQKDEYQLAKLRASLGLPADAEPRRVYASAARAEGEHLAPDFLAAEHDRTQWLLADRAFIDDAKVLPSEAALREQLEKQKSRFTRWWLRAGTLAVGPDRSAALQRAAAIADQLHAAAHPDQLLARIEGLEISTLGPISPDELRRSQPLVQRALAGAGAGGWRGPLALSTPDLRTPQPAGSERGPYRSLSFVFLERSELPPLAEVRGTLLRDHRGRIGGSVDAFMRDFGRFWDVELLVP